MSGNSATRRSSAKNHDDDENWTGDDEEKQRILLEAGGDGDDEEGTVWSSKKDDLFPHTTADMLGAQLWFLLSMIAFFPLYLSYSASISINYKIPNNFQSTRVPPLSPLQLNIRNQVSISSIQLFSSVIRLNFSSIDFQSNEIGLEKGIQRFTPIAERVWFSLNSISLW